MSSFLDLLGVGDNSTPDSSSAPRGSDFLSLLGVGDADLEEQQRLEEERKRAKLAQLAGLNIPSQATLQSQALGPAPLDSYGAARDAVGETAKNIGQALVQPGSSLVRGTNLLAKGVGEGISGLFGDSPVGQVGQSIADTYDAAARQQEQFQREQLTPDPLPGALSQAFRTGGMGAVGIAPMIGEAAMAGPGSPALFGLTSGAEEAQAASDQGATPTQALTSGAITGAANYSMFAGGLKPIVESLTAPAQAEVLAGRKAAMAAFKQSGHAGLMGMATGLAQRAGQELLYSKKYDGTPDEQWQQAMTDATDAVNNFMTMAVGSLAPAAAGVKAGNEAVRSRSVAEPPVAPEPVKVAGGGEAKIGEPPVDVVPPEAKAPEPALPPISVPEGVPPPPVHEYPVAERQVREIDSQLRQNRLSPLNEEQVALLRGPDSEERQGFLGDLQDRLGIQTEPAPTANQNLATKPKMVLRVGKTEIPLEDVNQASAVWSAYRDKNLLGASDSPKPLIVVDGEVRGYVAYNGKVFEGRPEDWKSGAKPVYDPSAESSPPQRGPVPPEALGAVAPDQEVVSKLGRVLYRAKESVLNRPDRDVRRAQELAHGKTLAEAHGSLRTLNDLESLIPKDAKKQGITADEMRQRVNDALYGRGPTQPMSPAISERVASMRARLDRLSTTAADQVESLAREWEQNYLSGLPDPGKMADAQKRIAYWAEHGQAEKAPEGDVEAAKGLKPSQEEVKIGRQYFLADIMRKNRGEYGHIAYQAHVDTGRADDVWGRDPLTGARSAEPSHGMMEIVQAVKALPKQEGYPDYSQMPDREVADHLWTYVREQTGKFDKFSGSIMPKVDTGVYEARGEVPQPYRDLLGEITDPIQRGNVTAKILAKNVAMFDMLDTIKDLGLRDGFVLKPGEKKVGFNKIEGMSSQDPLAGYSMREDHQKILDNAMKQGDLHFVVKALNEATAATKGLMTVANPTTQSGNALANVLMAAADGDLVDFKAPWKSVAPELNVPVLKVLERSSRYGTGRGAINPKPALMRYKIPGMDISLYEYGVQKGVFGNQIDLADQAAMRRRAGKDVEEVSKTAGALRGGLKHLWGAAQSAYLGADEMLKGRKWLKEAQKRLYYGSAKDLHEALEQSADYVLDTTMTAERSYRWNQAIRQAPVAGLVGTFTTWGAEVPRNLGNVIKQASKEIYTGTKTGNSKMVGVGTHRALSLLAAFGALPAAAAIIGGPFKKAREFSEFFPDYMKNHLMGIISAENGKVQVIDFSRINPFGVVYGPGIAAKRELQSGGGALNAGLEAFKEYGSPVLTPGVIVNPMIDTIRGETDRGRKIYSKDLDRAATKGERSAAYMADATLNQGVFRQAGRAAAATDPTQKILETLTGLLPRVYTFDLNKELPKAAGRLDRAADEDLRSFWRSSLYTDKSDSDRKAAYDLSLERSSVLAQKIMHIVASAKQSGLDEQTVYDLMAKGNMAKGYIEAAQDGEQAIKDLIKEKMDEDFDSFAQYGDDWRE